MNNHMFHNYQSTQQDDEEMDNTDSGSYPSVFDLQLSNVQRRLGRRNRKASSKLTHPIIPAADSSSSKPPSQRSFLRQGPLTSLENIPSATDAVDLSLPKHFPLGPAIGQRLEINQGPLSSLENMSTMSHKDFSKPKPLPDPYRPAIEQKLEINQGPFTYPENISKTPRKDFSLPKPLADPQRPAFGQILEINQGPLSSLENISKTPRKDFSIPKPLADPQRPAFGQILGINQGPLSSLENISKTPRKDFSLPKPLLDPPKPTIGQRLEINQGSLSSVENISTTPRKDFCTPKPLSDKLNCNQESLPVLDNVSSATTGCSNSIEKSVFKKPISVNTFKIPNPIVPQEKNHKPMADSVVKSNAPIVGKSQAESSKDIVTVNNTQYKVLGQLGSGGSSCVYNVQDNQGQEMALKVVNLSTITDQSTADGYLKEVQYLEKLQGCPCVIKMYDYEYDTRSKNLFVVMEKGEGDLSRYLKNMKKMPSYNVMMRVLMYWNDMLMAVKAIHAEGIIHSDLKPANFLFIGGQLKLIDFGIASSLQGDQTSVYKDIASGTLNYMSPESVQDVSRVSFRADVWSLGCILYNMIYSKTPYSHIPNQWAKMKAIGDPKVLVEFKPQGFNNMPVPPVLLDSMKMCLQKDLRARPTVEQLLNIVQSFLYGRTIQTPIG